LGILFVFVTNLLWAKRVRDVELLLAIIASFEGCCG
jgi:hypothetical protein